MNRCEHHPILADAPVIDYVEITIDGKPIKAIEGEMIAAALLANGISTFRYTHKNHKPRGLYCGIGRCTDCIMTVDGIPNIRTCVTPVKKGMQLTTQIGYGGWQKEPCDA